MQNAETGSVTLQDGQVVTGDLIIAADGVHSQAAKVVLGEEARLQSMPSTVYRFVIPLEDIDVDEESKWFLDAVKPGLRVWAGEGKRLVCYPCRE